MITDEKKVFEELSELLKQAVVLLESRITQIKDKQLSPTISKVNQEADFCLREFQIKSLKTYRDTISFLSNEILNNDQQHHIFLLPNTRKLFDIYARYLHLLKNCHSDNRRALTCIAYQLLLCKDLEDKKAYDELLLSNKDLLDEERYTFVDFANFDYAWYLRHSDLAFRSTRDLFKEDIINKYSNPPVKIFKGQNIVGLYASLSEICHGNPYYYYDTPHNERFWVATVSFMVTSYVINLIDTYFLNKVSPKDFRVWLNNVNKASNSMISIWRSKRKQTA